LALHPPLAATPHATRTCALVASSPHRHPPTRLSLSLHHPPPTDIYTLSLHDALPICRVVILITDGDDNSSRISLTETLEAASEKIGRDTSELQSHLNLVCRLLLEKKKYYKQCNNSVDELRIISPERGRHSSG